MLLVRVRVRKNELKRFLDGASTVQHTDLRGRVMK